MQYTSRVGDRASQAHINYDCPCGCVAGLTYDRESGAEHLGACCCGRLLWVGDDAGAVVRTKLEAGVDYVFELDSVNLPWGGMATTALAVPASELAAVEAPAPARVRDVVCGMMIDPTTAAATSVHKGETFYFCATACKRRFDAAPETFLTK